MACFLQANFSPDFVKNMVLHLIIAGRDTTACLLSWMFYELAKNQDVQVAIGLFYSSVHATGQRHVCKLNITVGCVKVKFFAEMDFDPQKCGLRFDHSTCSFSIALIVLGRNSMFHRFSSVFPTTPGSHRVPAPPHQSVARSVSTRKSCRTCLKHLMQRDETIGDQT